MTNTVLEINNLGIELSNTDRQNDGDGKTLMQGLSLRIPKQKTVALVGTSGAGKSMTSLAVMGLLPEGIRQTHGKIMLNERDLSTLNAEQFRQTRNTEMSMIMQNPMSAFDSVFTIRSHFFETMRSHTSLNGAGQKQNKKDMEMRACHALRETGFANPEAILKIYPFQMSGGMLQRVMIALALIDHPQLLIADEATTDLDVVSQAAIIRLLRQRTQERQMSVLLITHDLSVAANFADEMVVVHEGEMIETGSVQDIMHRPQQPFTQEFVRAHLDLYQGDFSVF